MSARSAHSGIGTSRGVRARTCRCWMTTMCTRTWTRPTSRSFMTMSTTRASRTRTTMPRRPLDFYETPPHYVAALLGEVNLFGDVFEPCAGEGAISDVLSKMGQINRVFTNDIDPARAAYRHDDARDPETWAEFEACDWTV